MVIVLVVVLATWFYLMLLQGRDSYLRPLETWSVGVDWLICAVSIGLPAWWLIRDGRLLVVMAALVLAMGLFWVHDSFRRKASATVT